MTDEEARAIKAREEQATFGPWDADPPTWGIVQRGRPLPIVYGNAHYGVWTDADAAFIAHAREDIPKLLTERSMLLEIVQAVATYPTSHDEDAQLTILRARAQALLGEPSQP